MFVLLPKTQRLKDIKTQNNEQVKLVSREGFVRLTLDGVCTVDTRINLHFVLLILCHGCTRLLY